VLLDGFRKTRDSREPNLKLGELIWDIIVDVHASSARKFCDTKYCFSLGLAR